jgi:hypothetical protein
VKTAADFIRPSSLAAIAQCPGRPTMEAAVVNLEGEQPDSPEASMGHQGHEIIGRNIECWRLSQEPGGLGKSWDEIIAQAADETAAAGMSSWDSWCVRFCLEFARDLIAKYGIEPENVLVEHRMGMADLGMAGGTGDLILVVPFKRVIVTDWKLGYVETQSADENDQTQAYGVAAAGEFKTKEVLVYIVTPRAEKDYRVTSGKFDAKALEESTCWTRAVVARAQSNNQQLAPDYSACVYCRALRQCPAVKEHFVNVQEAIAVLGDPSSPETWGEAIGAAKLAEKWGETWKEAGKAHLMGGGQASGFKLGAGRSIESVANVPEAVRLLREAGMEAEALEAASISAGKLPPAARAVIESHITTKISAPSLVADKRNRST